MDANARRFRKRDAILSCLRSSRAHPSAEMLYRQLHEEHPDISLATVYRNLALFKQQGLAVSVGTVDGAERFDGRTDPHMHFVCARCGAILDLPACDTACGLCSAASEALGCRIDSVSLTFSGVCKDCLNQNQN